MRARLLTDADIDSLWDGRCDNCLIDPGKAVKRCPDCSGLFCRHCILEKGLCSDCKDYREGL